MAIAKLFAFHTNAKTAFKYLNLSCDIKNHPLIINMNLFKQLNINQMFDKIQMILMMKLQVQIFDN